MGPLLALELAAARRVRGGSFPVDAALAAAARDYEAALTAGERRALDEAAAHWIDADSVTLEDWPDVIGLGRAYPDRAALAAERSDTVEALSGSVEPTVALAFQAASGGCEAALELLYDARTDRLCSLVVRGCPGGAFSNLGLFCSLSPRYAVLPVFHTHPALTNDIGLRKASRADYQALRRLQQRLGGGPVGERVYFPDGSCTDYGLGTGGQPFDCRCAAGVCTLLPRALLD